MAIFDLSRPNNQQSKLFREFLSGCLEEAKDNLISANSDRERGKAQYIKSLLNMFDVSEQKVKEIRQKRYDTRQKDRLDHQFEGSTFSP